MSLLTIRYFLGSNSPYFFKTNGFQLLKKKVFEMTLKYGKTEAQSWPEGNGTNNI